MKEKEFEKQTLEQLLNDIKDIDNYKSFRNGAFVYDLGYYQGQLILQEINRLNNKINEAIEYIEQDYDKNQEIIEYCNFEDFYKKILKLLKGEE